MTQALTERGVRRDTSKFLRGVDPAELVETSSRLHRFTKPVRLRWATPIGFSPSTSPTVCMRHPQHPLVEIPGGRTYFPLDEPATGSRRNPVAFRPRR
jgi:hypothetical protein